MFHAGSVLGNILDESDEKDVKKADALAETAEEKAARIIYAIYRAFFDSEEAHNALPDNIACVLLYSRHPDITLIANDLCVWFNTHRQMIENWYKNHPYANYTEQAEKTLEEVMYFKMAFIFEALKTPSTHAINTYGDLTRFMDDEPLLQSVLYPVSFDKIGNDFIAIAKANDMETAIQIILPKIIAVVEKQLLPAVLQVVEKLEMCHSNPLDMLAKSYLIKSDIMEDNEKYEEAYQEEYRKSKERLIYQMVLANTMGCTIYQNTLKSLEKKAFFDLYVNVFQYFFFGVSQDVEKKKHYTFSQAINSYKENPELGFELIEKILKKKGAHDFTELLEMKLSDIALFHSPSSKTVKSLLEYDTNDKQDVQLLEERLEKEGVREIIKQFRTRPKKIRINDNGDENNFYVIAANFLQKKPRLDADQRKIFRKLRRSIEKNQLVQMKAYLEHQKEAIQNKSFFHPWFPFFVSFFNPKIKKLDMIAKEISRDLDKNILDKKLNYIEKTTSVLGGTDKYIKALKAEIVNTEALIATDIFLRLRAFFTTMQIKNENSSSLLVDIELPELKCEHSKEKEDCLKFYSSHQHIKDATQLIKWVRDNSNNILRDYFFQGKENKKKVDQKKLSETIQLFQKWSIQYDTSYDEKLAELNKTVIFNSFVSPKREVFANRVLRNVANNSPMQSPEVIHSKYKDKSKPLNDWSNENDRNDENNATPLCAAQKSSLKKTKRIDSLHPISVAQPMTTRPLRA